VDQRAGNAIDVAGNKADVAQIGQANACKSDACVQAPRRLDTAVEDPCAANGEDVNAQIRRKGCHLVGD
jgi:hypothetical protein